MISYVVVDASVSLKWALDDEDDVEQAVAIRDHAIAGQFQIVVPSLWLYEVSNGLAMSVRRGRIEPDVGKQALTYMLALGIRLADPETQSVYAQALRHGITAYDAAYLALAETLGVPLWTGDRRLYEKVEKVAPFVRWVGDYS